ncbi:gas vesicle protein [Streptomyces sp. SID5910]|uniref:gas vesicle protein GvpO n=1 Tax=Streptomyces sp. SID5910 TaxID=2690312 RepID=UPI0013683FF9|nr:gas vesicle protein [Streptomyces sp. SID5910]MYR43841.1 gas vesicle protein [Streptomyces sp. SID5910]MYR44333.1 gas vesicle protein [Streptomyces sp. SID5910]
MSNTNNTSESQSPQQSSRKTQSSRTQSSRKTQDSQEPQDSQESQESQNSHKARRPRPMEILREARAQLAELTGMTAESVSSFEQTEEGWSLEVEVLELERVPDTMSLMGSYQVELDPDGQLTGYRRVRRYERGRADARGSGGR